MSKKLKNKVIDEEGNTMLHAAVESNDIDLVKQLIAAGCNVNVKTECHIPPLWHAIKDGHLEMVETLLNAGAFCKGNRLIFYGPLHCAAVYSWPEIVKLLIKVGADVNEPAKMMQHTPLHVASKKESLEVVRILIESGADVKARDGLMQQTPLHMAAESGLSEIVQLLIEVGADVNACDKHESTPLHCANDYCGKDENACCKIIKLLVEAEAKINAMDQCGDTPMVSAVKRCCSQRFEFMLSLGADISKEGKIDCNLAFEAARYNNLYAMKHLVESGFNVNNVDRNGNSCLHKAASRGSNEVVEFLLCNGAAINVNNDYGLDPLCYALVNYEDFLHEYYDELMEYDESDCSNDDYDEIIEKVSPESCIENYVKCFDMLIKHGANVNRVIAGTQLTPLYIVLDDFRYHSSFVKVLLKNGAKFDFENLSVREAINNSKGSKFPLLLLRHTATFEAQGRRDGPINFDIKKLDKKTQEDYARCQEELELMRTMKIDDTNVSFFNVLVNPDIGPYTRNKSIANAFETSDISELFPVYSDLLTERFLDEVEFQKLIKAALENLSYILNWDQDSEHIVLSKVISYLDKKDLINLSLIAKNS